jgi:hypothetical protein
MDDVLYLKLLFIVILFRNIKLDYRKILDVKDRIREKT